MLTIYITLVTERNGNQHQFNYKFEGATPRTDFAEFMTHYANVAQTGDVLTVAIETIGAKL